VRLEVQLSIAVEISDKNNAPLHRVAEKVDERLVGSFGVHIDRRDEKGVRDCLDHDDERFDFLDTRHRSRMTD